MDYCMISKEISPKVYQITISREKNRGVAPFLYPSLTPNNKINLLTPIGQWTRVRGS